MKRRYLALMMGLTLAAVPAGAYAQETETETQEIVIALEDTEENEQTDVDNQEKEEALWGKVIAVSEDEITIAVGTLKEQTEAAEQENVAADDTEAPEEASDSIEEQENAAADDTELTENSAAFTINVYERFEPTGEEMTIPIADAAEIYFGYGDIEVAYLELEEVNGTEDIGNMSEEVNGTEDTEKVSEEVNETEDTEKVSEEVNGTVDAEKVSEEVNGTEKAENMSEEVNGIETVSEENVMVELEEAEWTDILTDDLVKITLDEDGNAGIILIAMADQV